MASASLGRIQTRCQVSILHPFRWHPWTTGTTAERLQLIPAGQERVLNKYGYPPEHGAVVRGLGGGGENRLIVSPRSNPLLP